MKCYDNLEGVGVFVMMDFGGEASSILIMYLYGSSL